MLKIGFHRRQGGRLNREEPHRGDHAGRFRRPQTNSIFTIKGRGRRHALSGDKGSLVPQCRTASSFHNEDRQVLENMDSLPWVTPSISAILGRREIFSADICSTRYISFYTGRGCKSTLHLLPVAPDGRRTTAIGVRSG